MERTQKTNFLMWGKRICRFALLALAVSSCSKLIPAKPTPAADPTAASYELVLSSGNSQTGTAGNSLTYAFVATVNDKTTGQPANGVQVDWSVVNGGGNLNDIYDTTTRTGIVNANLTLGATAGTNTVNCKIHGSSDAGVSFTATGSAGGVSSLHSSINGSGPVENDGINTSTITIVLADANNNKISGRTPTFTSTGSANSYGACTVSDASGVSTCTLASTTAETKVLSITNPTIIGGTVVFAPGSVSASHSTIVASGGPVTANGSATATLTITLKDASNVGVGGITPTFSATNTGLGNTNGACTSTNASGVSTCTLASTVAETKTVSLTSPVSVSGNSVVFAHGPASSLHSTITGTGPVEPDGTSTSAISITLKDANNNAISGTVPTFSATDSSATNSYGVCSSSNASGLSTCTLSSTVTETKTLSLATPTTFSGGTVVFAPTAVVAAHSSITGTTPVIANGVATSIITITLKDSSSVPVGGVVPTFTATNTNSGNTYGTCSSSSASTGISTCTLASTYAESKTLSLASPVNLTGGTVVFNPGPLSAATATITGTTSIVANGTATSTISIHLSDANNNAISGVVPTFAATDTGTTNTYASCSASSGTGASTCTMTSTKAELKTLSIVTPSAVTGGTITFIAGPASISSSTITGTGPVSPDGTSTSSISISLKDVYNNPVAAVVPTFSATNTGTTNIYGTCSSTSALGASTCTLASTHPETKTLSLLTPISMSGGTVLFTPGSASSLNSTITGTGPETADGIATSTITITLKDGNNIPIPGTIPTFSATDTNNTNIYGACSTSSASGVSTCSLSSLRAEVKTLAMVSPVSMNGGTVTFQAGSVSAANSQITGTGPVTADGTASSTVTIVLYDANNNPIASTVPSFSATDTGSTNVYGVCSSSTSTGSSTCTLKATKAEVKTLSITSPVLHAGGTVSFVSQGANAAHTTITGTSPVPADGTTASTITVTLQDINSNAVAGVVPTFSATNTGTTNVYGACSTSNTSGVSTCTLKSTHTESKVLSLTAPVTVTGGTVVFSAAPASSATSTIVGTGPVNADGTATSTVTITLKDVNSNALVGATPTFTVSGSNNTLGACSATNASGVSTCTLKSTTGETKTLSLATPIVFAGGTVVFTTVASPTNSTISGTSPVTANGTASSTITVTLKDYANNGISGIVPTFTATDTGSTNSYTTCSSTSASGISTCTLKSTHAESKTLTLATPISLTGGPVVFAAGAASTATSSIVGTGPINADGISSSTVTITLLDANSNPIFGTVPTFSATNTGTTNVYGTCSSSNASGVSTCTLKATKAETKVLSLVTPISMTGGSVVFNQAVYATDSTIAGTTSIAANNAATSTITITLKDYTNTAIAGLVPTFTATDTGSTNTYGVCAATNSSGVSTCTLMSSKAETKTLSLSTPAVFTGGTVVFTQAASTTYTTITGSGPVIADGVATSTITITLKDYTNVAMVGTTPTFTATNTGTANTYGACSSSDASGVSTCTLKSTYGETKTLSLATPVAMTGGTVVFSQVANSSYTSISGTTNIAANGTTASTITITLKDYSNTAIAGVTPTFSATDTGSSNNYGTCSASSASGISTCTLKSTHAESKTLSLLTPIALTGGSVIFTQAASPSLSSISGSGPVNADGAASSTVTITLKDYANAAIAGTVPTFSATNTSSLNAYGTCSSSNASGVSTCTLKSTKAETKVLSLVTPAALSGGSVVFNQVAYASNSTITGTGSVAANNSATSTVSITIRDYANVAVVGITPTFSATDTNSTNVYGACGVTNASGIATCTLKSSFAETKTLSITAPVTLSGGTVVFTQTASPTNSTITGTGPTTANGSAHSTITITILDYAGNGVSGVVPTFSATDTGSTNTYIACSSTTASGASSCQLKSTHAETKTLQILTPVSKAGGNVVFN